MGLATDTIGDVIRGNLSGAEANMKLTQGKIDELQVELDRFTAEAAEYRLLLAGHTDTAGEIRASETLAVAQEGGGLGG